MGFPPLLFFVLISFGLAYDPFNEAVERDRSLQRVDQCFCELQGPVDVCCCDVETVDSLNCEKIYPLITSLVEFPFFKFYQVNLNQPCPFWPDDSTCMTKLCDVKECEETEIPVTLKICDQEQEENLRLSYVNSTVSTEQREDFRKWEKYDDSEESFCESDADRADMIYVDLLLNPERFTGYSGVSAHRVWNSIYKENCFRPETHSPVVLPFESSLVQGMCLEKRAFFRILSGMHSSINIHLSALYRQTGPSWLKNLYFSYLLVLRAITKMEVHWIHYQFYTGNVTEDASVKEKIIKIVQAAKGCSNSLFDETMLFTGNTSFQLKETFRAHFKNITRIMDCVGCSKCKLWGKLQVHGIGTALKILFSGKKSSKITIQRREIVALFNVLGKFSSSIHLLQNFRNLKERGSTKQKSEL